MATAAADSKRLSAHYMQISASYFSLFGFIISDTTGPTTTIDLYELNSPSSTLLWWLDILLLGSTIETCQTICGRRCVDWFPSTHKYEYSAKSCQTSGRMQSTCHNCRWYRMCVIREGLLPKKLNEGMANNLHELRFIDQVWFLVHFFCCFWC